MVRRTTIREVSASRHHEGTIEGLPEVGTSRQYGTEGLNGASSIISQLSCENFFLNLVKLNFFKNYKIK